MRVITTRDLIRQVAKRWFQTYQSSLDQSIFNGTSKRAIWQELTNLNLETATEQDVSTIIGNESWTRITCDECKQNVDTVIQLGDEPDYESATACICRECLTNAVLEMAKS